MQQFSGRRLPSLAELLKRGHELGLEGIATVLVQAPAEQNGHLAIVKAVVRLRGGREFSGHGDASPANVRKGIEQAIVRMAETRAVARALRFALGVAETALEELGEATDALPPVGPRRESVGVKASAFPRAVGKSPVSSRRAVDGDVPF